MRHPIEDDMRILKYLAGILLFAPATVLAEPEGNAPDGVELAAVQTNRAPYFPQPPSPAVNPQSAVGNGMSGAAAASPQDALENGEQDEPLLRPVKKIVLDPGHGGANEGAIGVANIYEKYLTLQVAMLLADKLRKALPDVEIILTRQKDESIGLAQRIDIANQNDADLFVSLHFNSSQNPNAVGFESFWAGDFWEADMVKENTEITPQIRSRREKCARLGKKMAENFNRAMRRRFDVLDRGVKPGDFTVLTRANVPAVVLEMAFLSHAQEGVQTTTAAHRAKLIDAITDAITRYTRSGDPQWQAP